jgi:1-acyl-sn-glycerol-3-phosphate acyltransferase
MTNYVIPKFNRHEVDKLFKRDMVNYNGVPAFLSATLSNISDISRFKTVHHMISGGAALPYASQQAINKALRKSGSKAVVEVGYGITEGSGGVSFTLVGADEAGCIGIPTPSTNMKIVDPKTGKELGYGEDGEICFSGPSVMKAYLNNPEETAKCLRVDEDGQIWFHSGDMGKVKENGCFYFSDRIKRMIIVSGENVYPNRIEKEIIDNFGDVVADCFVISKADASKGEVPLAKVLLKPGITPTIEIRDAIIAMIKDKFKNKKYWPVGLDFIKSVPMTKMSKADFKALNDPDLIVKLDEPKIDKTTETNRLKDNYGGNRFYMTSRWFYSHLPKYQRNITFKGRENIPEKGAAIIAMNHLNAQDQNAVMTSVDRIVSLPAKKEYFDGRISGWFMRKLEMIPVDRFGDTLYAREWIKGILETAKLNDYEIERPIIDDIIRYVDSLNIGPKSIKNVNELVNTVLDYISTKYENSELRTSITDRITDMPTKGVENGYGRTMKVNQEVSNRLSAGQLVGVFPEGTRNSDFADTGILLPFHSGAVRWARDSFAPIIPTAITGEHKRGGDILIRSGEPIKIDSDLTESEVKEATQELHDKIYELLLMNLADQDNEVNNRALRNAIKYLESQNDQKSKDLLAMIYAQLGKTDSERNEEFRRAM